jgi:hypothetical protein
MIYILVKLLDKWATLWSKVLLEKLTVAQLVKKFSTLYAIRRFITVFTRVRRWSLSWATCIQSTPSHLISLISSPILSYHLRVGLPSSLFVSDFPAKILCEFLISTMHAICPTDLIHLHFITLITFAEAYKLWSSSSCSLLQSPPS